MRDNLKRLFVAKIFILAGDFEFRINVLPLRHKFFYNCLSFKFKQNASKNQIAATWSQTVCLLSHCDS